MKKILKNIFTWLYIAICVFSIPTYGVQMGTILLSVSAIMLLPFESMARMWKRVPIKIMKPLLVTALFLVGVCILPQPEQNPVAPVKELELEVTEVPPIEKQTSEPTETQVTLIAENTVEPTKEAVSTVTPDTTVEPISKEPVAKTKFGYKDVPKYSGEPFVEINNNVPFFSEEDMKSEDIIRLSELDELGRCGVTMMRASMDTAPEKDEERGNISTVKPSGWHSGKDGTWQRGHLLGWQLSALNAEPRNLITSTQYMNIEGFLPFENQIDDYIEENPENSVLYRVTPVFVKNELVCRGCLLEAKSLEDNGSGVQFCVFAYNVQPGVKIDYATGKHEKKGAEATKGPLDENSEENHNEYIININTGKFHYPTCSSVGDMNDEHKKEYAGSSEDLVSQGYSPCGRCRP